MSVRIDKKEEVALRNLLYTQRGEPTLVAMKTLVESNLERLKEEFIDCTLQELADKQSEAKAWRRMLKYMIEKPMSS